jgi:hypothetical protein
VVEHVQRRERRDDNRAAVGPSRGRPQLWGQIGAVRLGIEAMASSVAIGTPNSMSAERSMGTRTRTDPRMTRQLHLAIMRMPSPEPASRRFP